MDAHNAISEARYSRWDGERLTAVIGGASASSLAQRVHAALRAVILDPEFPCVASRSAFNQGSYRFALYSELCSDAATTELANDLEAFVREQPEIEGEFSTFVAVFDTPKAIQPEDFERLLWQQLEALHALDAAPWDPDVSSDPADPQFSFSFGGRAFFIVGLSPNGERWARTFPWPALAFNAHFQFEQLREQHKFERMQSVVRDRDRSLEGDTNPNLSDFGEHTDARQYSGRAVGDDWRCPVSFEPPAGDSGR